jgi:diguanylate cyclase (GGDEF)-like protein
LVTFNDTDRRRRVDELNAEATALGWLDYDRLQRLADEAFELACQKDADGRQYPYGMASALSLLAERNCTVGEWSTALSEAAQGLSLLESQPVTPVTGALHQTVGWTRYFLGDYVQALESLKSALRVAEEIDDRSLEAYVLDRVASVQGSAGQLVVALETHKRSLAMHREGNDRLGEARALNNIAYTYMDLGKLGAALEAAGRSLALTQEIGSVHLLAGVYDTLAEVELRCGKLDEAERFSRKGLETARACNSEPDTGDSMFMLGRIECARGNWIEAIEATEQALTIAERLGSAVEEYKCHELLSEICERNGDVTSALWHHRRFHDLESAKRTRETESRVARLAVEHQVESARKDAEIHRLRSLALEREVEEGRVAQVSLEAQASLDPLTGLFNRRHTAVLREELRRAIRQGQPVSLTMFDIDRFKSVNDERGHAAGDQVLVSIAAELRGNARKSDMPCRWGGDEFLVLLVGMDADAAGSAAERLRLAVAETSVICSGAAISVTLSAGVASVDAQSPVDFDSLVARADAALYAAKAAGRNRVVVGEGSTGLIALNRDRVPPTSDPVFLAG